MSAAPSCPKKAGSKQQPGLGSVQGLGRRPPTLGGDQSVCIAIWLERSLVVIWDLKPQTQGMRIPHYHIKGC